MGKTAIIGVSPKRKINTYPPLFNRLRCEARTGAGFFRWCAVFLRVKRILQVFPVFGSRAAMVVHRPAHRRNAKLRHIGRGGRKFFSLLNQWFKTTRFISCMIEAGEIVWKARQVMGWLRYRRKRQERKYADFWLRAGSQSGMYRRNWSWTALSPSING